MILRMRLIGHLPDSSGAKLFSDYLLARGISNEVEPDDGRWAVWVHEEEQLSAANDFLGEYRRNPSDPKYQRSAAEAARLKKEDEKAEKMASRRYHDRKKLFRKFGGYNGGMLTLILIVVSAAVGLLSGLGDRRSVLLPLFITEFIVDGSGLDRLMQLSEIRHGQIWRLVTPVFVHFGILHLLFNMMWLYDLGGMIEARLGRVYFGLLALALAVFSNLGELMVSGPLFGGMSGVVYGLLGFIWIRGKFDPGSGLYLHPKTVTFMIIWFFLCLSGMIGNIANTAHGVGLVLGAAWGYTSAQMSDSRR